MCWVVKVEWPNGETHTEWCRDADVLRAYVKRLKKNTPDATFKVERRC